MPERSEHPSDAEKTDAEKTDLAELIRASVRDRADANAGGPHADEGGGRRRGGKVRGGGQGGHHVRQYAFRRS